MKDHYTAYVRQVGHELDVPWRQKKELLRGLQSELRERFSEVPSEEELLTDVGQPKEVARALLAGVDPKERERHRAGKLLRFRCVVAILAILLVLGIGACFYFETTQIERADVTIVQGSISTYYSANAESE